VRSLPLPSTLVELGDNTGTQGNPSLHVQNGAVLSVWTDDEYGQDADTGRITAHVVVSGVFPTSSRYTTVELPAVVNQPGTTAIQPTFRDEGLCFTQDTSIAFAAYAGLHEAASLASDANWAAPVTLLQKDTTIAGAISTNDLGKIVAIGEPTLATVDGRLVLHFVYVWVRGIDPLTGLPDLDFQAGWIERNR